MKIGLRRPVDSTAARVVSTGEHFEYRPLHTEVCSAVPLPVVPARLDGEPLRGICFGRLTVKGRWDGTKKRWVCRCVCGNYVLRRATAIKQAAPDSACPQCYLMAVSKKNEFLRRTGQERQTREFMA